MAQQAPKDPMAELIALLKVYGNQSYHPDDGTLTISKLAVRQAEAIIDKLSGVGFSEGPNMEIRGKGTHDTTIVIRGSYIDALARHMAFPGLRQETWRSAPAPAGGADLPTTNPIEHLAKITHELGITWQRGTASYPVVLHVANDQAPVISGLLSHLKIEHKEEGEQIYLQNGPDIPAVLEALERVGQPGLPDRNRSVSPSTVIDGVETFSSLAIKINSMNLAVSVCANGTLTLNPSTPQQLRELEATFEKSGLHYHLGDVASPLTGVRPVVIADRDLSSALMNAGLKMDNVSRHIG